MGSAWEGVRMMGVRYELRVVGQLWMGGTAATSSTVREPMEYPQAEGESDVEYECRMVECAAQMGDFQSVDAVEIERVTDTATGDRGHVTHYEIIQPFSEDAEMTWCDCMEPADF